MLKKVRSLKNSHHMIIFVLLTFFLFDLLPDVFLSRFLVLIIACGVLFHMKQLSFSYTKWHDSVLFFAVCFYLTFAIFGLPLFFMFNLFPAHWIGLSKWSMLLIFMLGFCWTTYVLISAFDSLKFLENRKIATDFFVTNKYWHKWLLLFGLIVIFLMLWQRAFNPIIMSPDSWTYFGRNGVFRIRGAVLFSFINSLIVRFAPTSPAHEWIPIFYIFVMSILFSTILMYFHVRWIRFKWVLAAAVVLPLIPSLGLHVITLWPDMLNGMKMLWFTYVLVRVMDEVVINKTSNRKQIISLCIQFCISFALLFFVRSNTMYAWLFMLPVLAVFFVFQKQWRLVLTLALSIVIVLIVRFPGYEAIGARQSDLHDNHRFKAGLHDIQSVYFFGGSLSERTHNMLYTYIPNTYELRDGFRHDWVHWQIWDRYNLHNLGIRNFVIAYADTFVRNPLRLTRSMMARTHHYWTINPDRPINNVNRTDIFCRTERVRGDQAPEIGVFRNANFLTRGANIYMDMMVSRTPATFVWRFGIWTALLIISIAHLIFRKRYVWIIAYIPVLAYLVTIFLASGWTDYRYGLPIFLIGMFLPTVTLLLNSKYGSSLPNKPNRKR